MFADSAVDQVSSRTLCHHQRCAKLSAAGTARLTCVAFSVLQAEPSITSRIVADLPLASKTDAVAAATAAAEPEAGASMAPGGAIATGIEVPNGVPVAFSVLQAEPSITSHIVADLRLASKTDAVAAATAAAEPEAGASMAHVGLATTHRRPWTACGSRSVARVADSSVNFARGISVTQ